MKHHLFFQIKKNLLYIKGYFITKNRFAVEVPINLFKGTLMQI